LSFYLVIDGTRGFGLKNFACAVAAVRCASKPRRRASSDIFCTNSRCLFAVGLSDLLVDLSSTIGGSSVASSYYSSTDTTSLESGFEIAGVSTADGGLAFLVLFYYFFSAALTAETTAAAIDNELPLTWSCARTSRRHQHPGLPRRRHRPQHRYLRQPPPTSQIHKTPAAELLEADTCPT
jgi:hypothetical protein